MKFGGVPLDCPLEIPDEVGMGDLGLQSCSSQAGSKLRRAATEAVGGTWAGT